MQFNNQVSRPKDFSGLITDNHLHSIYQQRPQVLNKVMRQLFKVNLQGALVNWYNRFPVEEVEQENGFYQWDLKGQEDKNLPLVDAQTTSGASVVAGTFPAAVGANRERFYLLFNEKLFNVTDVLKGESQDYHMLVQGEDEFDGKYRYEVELLNDDLDIAMPLQELAINNRFSKFYNAVSNTLSDRGSEPWFTSPFRMQNRMTTSRMQYRVPGNMINKGLVEPLEFGFSHKGETTKSWVNHIDLVIMAQCAEMEARGAIYGKKNWNVTGGYLNKSDFNQFSVETGSGWLEQIAASNRHKYNTFDLDYFSQMVLDMNIGKTGRGDRHIHLLTGEQGAVEFHTAVQNKMGNRWTIVSDDLVTKKTGNSNLGTANTAGFGVQFNEYIYMNGIKFTLEIMDAFDDETYHPMRHPDGKGIAESHRFLAMGRPEEAGISRVKAKGVDDIYSVIPGMRDPQSPGGKGKMKRVSSPIDGYEIHTMKQGGIKMEDPTQVVDWQVNVNR